MGAGRPLTEHPTLSPFTSYVLGLLDLLHCALFNSEAVPSRIRVLYSRYSRIGVPAVPRRRVAANLTRLHLSRMSPDIRARSRCWTPSSAPARSAGYVQRPVLAVCHRQVVGACWGGSRTQRVGRRAGTVVVVVAVVVMIARASEQEWGGRAAGAGARAETGAMTNVHVAMATAHGMAGGSRLGLMKRAGIGGRQAGGGRQSLARRAERSVGRRGVRCVECGRQPGGERGGGLVVGWRTRTMRRRHRRGRWMGQTAEGRAVGSSGSEIVEEDVKEADTPGLMSRMMVKTSRTPMGATAMTRRTPRARTCGLAVAGGAADRRIGRIGLPCRPHAACHCW